MRIYYADLEHTFGRDDFTIYAESKEDAYSIIAKKKECKKENGKYYHGDPEDDEWDEFFIIEGDEVLSDERGIKNWIQR